jgi:ElaB/YqjD/DUF883 family membrane-anchored ribosome-binding protein
MSAAESGPARATNAEQGMRDPAEIRVEIEDTREELGETVAAVAERTDVKKQAQAKKDELKERAAERASEAKAKVNEVAEKAKDAAPESATEGAEEAQRLARENPVPMAIACAFVAGLILGRMLWR